MSKELDVLRQWVRERNLGSGGFGVVTLWRNTKNDEKIAIKKYRRDSGDNITAKHKERWSKEVEMMKSIKNYNIVSFVEVSEDFEKNLQFNPTCLPILSMEYCSQGDLRSLLAQPGNCCGLPETDVRYILSDIMNAVSHLHELKITHRDLKPENIVLQLCNDRPSNIIYKLTDLGYAREIDAQSICASFVGTLQYLAPELLYSKTYSCSVDYWSMGLLVFEVICGVRPFLPNMSPAQWMHHVEKKSKETICIYQDVDESIVQSTEILLENHVSSCFKQEIEKWLKLALDFNPKARGYKNYDSNKPNNELLIFSSLKTLLEKKILSVFSVFTYNFHSYEIDDFTQVSTLQGWIERDTKIAKTDQILLSHNCEAFNSDGLAMGYFRESHLKSTVYLYKNSEILTKTIVTNPPILVRAMLDSPKKMLPYYFQKKSFAHALYFIYKQNNLYNTVLEACHLRIEHIMKGLDVCLELCKIANLGIEQLVAQKKFSKEILDFDFKQYLNNYSQNAMHWMDSYKIVAGKVDELHGLTKHLLSRYESIARRATMLENSSDKHYSKCLKHELNEIFEQALLCYSKIKSKDKNAQPDNCIKMVRILYDFLKTHDKLLLNFLFRQYLTSIVDIDLELKKLMIPLSSAIQHINMCTEELLNDHKLRQTKIWDFTIKQKFKESLSEANKSAEKTQNETSTKTEIMCTKASQGRNFILGNPKLQSYDNGEPISLEKPLNFILDEQVNNPIKCKGLNPSFVAPEFFTWSPASGIITENLDIRYALQEKNNESFLFVKEILDEPLDFTFLE